MQMNNCPRHILYALESLRITCASDSRMLRFYMGQILGAVNVLVELGYFTFEQRRDVEVLAYNALEYSGEPFPCPQNAGPVMSAYDAWQRERAAALEKQQAQVLPHERPESIPAPASPRGLRLLCLLVEKSGRKQYVPAVTLQPVPPRAPVSGSWALVCDPAFSLRETQAKPPRPSLLARYLRQWQANTLRPSF